VDALCRNLIEKVRKDGGLILDGANGLPDEARTENVRAMFEAAHRYTPERAADRKPQVALGPRATANIRSPILQPI